MDRGTRCRDGRELRDAQRSLHHATRTGYNGLTPDGVGTLVLVSPMRITSLEHLQGLIGANVTTAAFATLTLTFVPEPRTGLLLGVGLLALGGIRRRS